MKRAAAHLLGLYLALLLTFDKGFSYLYVWVGRFPLFVTEAVLAGLFILWLWLSLSKRRLRLPGNRWAFLLWGLFYLAGLAALVRAVPLPYADLVQTLKRSALFYYSIFTVLVASIFDSRADLRTILKWMFAGSVAKTLIYCVDMVRPLPSWWPVTVGVAAYSAITFCFLYASLTGAQAKRPQLMAMIAGLALGRVMFTPARSVFLVLLPVLLFVFFARFLGIRRLQPRWVGSIAAWTAVSMVFLGGMSGSPEWFARIRGLVGQQRAPQVVVDPVPVVVVAPAQGVPVPLDRGGDRYSAPHFIRKLEDRGSSGNLVWRMLVWNEGLVKTVRTHLFAGHGVKDATVIVSVCPYRSQERIDKAVVALKSRYNFLNRVSDTERRAESDVEADLPFTMLKSEMVSFYSPHWYDVDFHNSHIAIFYRFGLLGLLPYLLLLGTAVAAAVPLIKRGDPIATLLVGFLLWMLGVASFNVVLEGPFLGVVAWVAVGAILAWSRADEAAESLSGERG